MSAPKDWTKAMLEGGLRIHLIGVAGSGMSGIAGLLIELGHRVSGSDKVDSPEVKRLCEAGLDFHTPHRGELVRDCDLVVYSSAVRIGNPAYDAALNLGIPLLRRAEVLAAVLHAREGIVIAGMHGKTTTSAMAAHVLRGGGLHPGHYVGAEIPLLGVNAWWDSEGRHFVAEGDESDGTIRLFHPAHTILLNIEEEHLDFYPDLAAIFEAYRTLLRQTKGFFLYCADDENASKLASEFDKGIGYGSSKDAVYRFSEVAAHGATSTFDLDVREKKLGSLRLGVPGLHNVSNATAAVALAMELGIPFEKIATALESFRGAKRRFEELDAGNGTVRVFDDYGHHPTEVFATLRTAKSTGASRVMVMFQPHRFTRTKALSSEFATALAEADVVGITDIYPASEAPIAGITGDWLAGIVRDQGNHPACRYSPLVRMHHEIGNQVRDGDLVLSLGAGNIHEAGKKLAADLCVRAEMERLIPGIGVRLYEPLARYTTMRVGGPAQYWVEPESVDVLARLVRFCYARKIPLTVIGRGSNLLIGDGGIRGMVVRLTRGEFAAIRVEETRIFAGAGARFKQVSLAARAAGIGGFEWMEGIPGSVGGGMRMNAGAMGIETFSQVESFRIMERDGSIREMIPADIEVGYREAPLLDSCIALDTVFFGTRADSETIETLMQTSMRKRKESQPAASSAGCIFRNPDQIPAGKVIDELGLKNTHVGPARVSEIHGNFIVNDGGATASDVLQLIERIRHEVRQRAGIELHPEVRMLGEKEPAF